MHIQSDNTECIYRVIIQRDNAGTNQSLHNLSISSQDCLQKEKKKKKQTDKHRKTQNRSIATQLNT